MDYIQMLSEYGGYGVAMFAVYMMGRVAWYRMKKDDEIKDKMGQQIIDMQINKLEAAMEINRTITLMKTQIDQILKNQDRMLDHFIGGS